MERIERIKQMKRIEILFRRAVLFCIVAAAIGFGITWGGLFQENCSIWRGIVSWLLIWGAIDIYAIIGKSN